MGEEFENLKVWRERIELVLGDGGGGDLGSWSIDGGWCV